MVTKYQVSNANNSISIEKCRNVLPGVLIVISVLDMSVFFACFISRFMGSKLEFVLDTGVSLYRGSLRYAVCGSWKKS